MSPPRASLSRSWPIWALVAVVAVTLATLLWMRFWLESQQARTILESLAEEVEATLSPEPAPFFGQRLEEIAARAQRQHPEMARLVVSVFLPRETGAGRREQVVYPDSLLFGAPDWSRNLPRTRFDWTRDGETVIRLYLDLSLARSYQLNVLMGALAAAILLLAMLVGMGLHQQQRRLARNSVELSTVRGELAKLERRALVGQVSASLIHDLKKPVLHIREAARAGDREPRLREIAEHADLFLAMVRDLRFESLLSSDSAPPEFLYLDEVVAQSFNLVKCEAVEVEFDNRLPRDLPMILATPHRLIQVFSNLFLNSIQAMQRRGRLVVRGSREGAGLIRVEVEDSGPGIPPEALPYIFTPFYSASRAESSTGLGLYICRSLLDELGGSIQADPAFSGGARFILRFPVPPPGAARDRRPAAPGTEPRA